MRISSRKSPQCNFFKNSQRFSSPIENFIIFCMTRKALSLTELLVASILIGIIMLGVMSFNIGVKKMQETTNKTTLLAMRTAAAMTHITKNASLAIGHLDSLGIDDSGGNNWISFRLDKNDPITTPDDFTDDTWVVYIRDANTLITCEQTAAVGSVPVGNCGGNPTLTVLSQDIFATTFSVVNDLVSGIYVDIELDTRFDTTLDSAPITNPDYKLTTRINPKNHGGVFP
jgi:type II secretory pathway pseudopilin PulG